MWTGIKKQNKILNKTSCVTKTANFACVLAINLFRLSWSFFSLFIKPTHSCWNLARGSFHNDSKSSPFSCDPIDLSLKSFTYCFHGALDLAAVCFPRQRLQGLLHMLAVSSAGKKYGQSVEQENIKVNGKTRASHCCQCEQDSCPVTSEI